MISFVFQKILFWLVYGEEIGEGKAGGRKASWEVIIALQKEVRRVEGQVKRGDK